MAINQEQFIQAVRENFPLRSGLASRVHRDRLLQFKGLFPDPQTGTSVPWVSQGERKDFVLRPIERTGVLDGIVLDVVTGAVDRRATDSGHRDDLVSEPLQRFIAGSEFARAFRKYNTLVSRLTSGITMDAMMSGPQPAYAERVWVKNELAWVNGYRLSVELATVTNVVAEDGHVHREPRQAIFTIRKRPNYTVNKWEKAIWMAERGNKLERKREEWSHGEPASSADRKMLRDLFEMAAGGIYKTPITRALRRFVVQNIQAEPGKMHGIV